jgi:hypothetical protein
VTARFQSQAKPYEIGHEWSGIGIALSLSTRLTGCGCGWLLTVHQAPLRESDWVQIDDRYSYHAREKWYKACPESKDTKVLNMYIFNLQKRHCEWIACA